MCRTRTRGPLPTQACSLLKMADIQEIVMSYALLGHYGLRNIMDNLAQVNRFVNRLQATIFIQSFDFKPLFVGSIPIRPSQRQPTVTLNGGRFERNSRLVSRGSQYCPRWSTPAARYYILISPLHYV